MANNKSAKKRIRQNAVRRLRNRYRLATTRTAIKKLQGIQDQSAAQEKLPEVISLVDRCVKANLWHKNKGSRIKSQLATHVNKLG